MSVRVRRLSQKGRAGLAQPSRPEQPAQTQRTAETPLQQGTEKIVTQRPAAEPQADPLGKPAASSGQ
jgi:hypothetical protein